MTDSDAPSYVSIAAAPSGTTPQPDPVMRREMLEQSGWQLFEQNRWAEAELIFKQLLEINRTSEGGLQGRIACLRKLRSFREAESLLQEALQLHPESVGILCERAWLATEQQRYDDAIEAFAAALRRPQKDDTLLLWRVSLLHKQQRLDEADEAVDEAIKLFPQSVPLLVERGWIHFHLDRFEEAADTFSNVLQHDDKNEAALQGRVASLRLLGRYAEARREADRALNRRPNSPGLLSEVGWLEFEQGQYENAEKAFGQVLGLTERDPYARVNLAWSLERQDGKEALAKASKYCRDALAIEPKLPEARGCLGIVAFKQGRIREAEIQLRRSITEDPKKGHYADLGALYIQMGRYDDAESRLKEGLAIKPEDAAIHLQLGNLYLQMDRLKDATSQFRQAAALDPAHPDPPRALAISLMEDGKIVEAEGVLRAAIRKLDEFKRWRLHLTLCQVLTRMGEATGNEQLFEEALREVNDALRLQPQHADVLFHAGIVRSKLQDYRGSLQTFQRCQQVDTSRIDAEINARRVRALLRTEKITSRASAVASVAVGIIVALQLVTIWMLRWLYGDALVTPTMTTILVPICLGLLIVSVVLPWLHKLKIAGFEAELSEPQAKEAFASGPKGEIGFGNVSRTISPVL